MIKSEEFERLIATKCPVCEEEILRLCMSIAGRKGGRSRSPAKVAAARENGKKGGRPKSATARRREEEKRWKI